MVHTLTIPTCYLCDCRFTINRVNKTTNKYGKCDTCGLVDMCLDCAEFVSENDDDGMECLMCSETRLINKGLIDKGIMKTDTGIWVGDSDVKCHIGNSYINKVFEITDITVSESELGVKTVNLDSSGNPVCAFGYCCEELYNRGALDGWENMWICKSCESELRKDEICGRICRDGSVCEERACSDYEYCRECMEIEIGMRNEEDLFEFDDFCQH